MKLLCVLFVFTFICFANGQSSSDIQKLNTPIATLASGSGSNIDAFSKKTAEDILKVISPSLSLQSLKSWLPLSPPLEKFLQSKSIADVIAYYDGFQMIPGITGYQVSLLQVIQMASSFDSPAVTMQVITSLMMLSGNTSISSALETSDSELVSRRYLTDLYPVLLEKLPKILNETRERFFISISKMPERYFKMLLKDQTIIDEILTSRRNMAFAMVRGSASKTQAASQSFQLANQKMAQDMSRFASIAMGMESMSVASSAEKCNISQQELRKMTLIQISLKCLGLPEDFPLLKLVPLQNFPAEILSIKVGDFATQLNMPFESLIKLTQNAILARYLVNKKQTPLHEPIFFVAKKQGLSVTNMNNNSLLDISFQILQMNVSTMVNIFNISQDVINGLNSTTLNQLPIIVDKLSSILYPTKYFYFLSMNSIMTLVNKQASAAARVNASENVEVHVNDLANEEIAKILGKTKAEIERTPLIEFISLIADKREQDVAQALKLSARNIALLQKMDLKTAEVLHRTFYGMNLVLNRPGIVAMSKVELYEMLTMQIKHLIMGKNMDTTLPGLAVSIAPVKQLIDMVANKFHVNNTILNTLTLNEIKFARGLSNDDFLNRTVLGVLQDLAKLSKEKFPSPDFSVPIISLSAKRGIPLSSLKNATFLDMIKRLSKSAWQIPLYIKSIKGNPGIKKYLKYPNDDIKALLRGPVEGFDSYNFTIKRLLDVFVGFDSKSHTAHSAQILLGFLKLHLGVREKVPLGINVSRIKDMPFLETGLPFLLKAVEQMKKDKYVSEYFMNTHNISRKLFELLKSEAEPDVGKLLAQSARNMVLFNPHKSINILFHMHDVVARMQRSFTKKPLKDVIRACSIKNPWAESMTIRNVFQMCFNQSSDEIIKTAFNTTKLLKPFLNISLAEVQDITGLGFDSLSKNLRDFMSAKTEDNYGVLFTPLKDFFTSSGISQAKGKQMTLSDVFMNPKFSNFNSMEYLKRKLVHGNNLEFLKNRSLEDLGVATETKDKDFSQTNTYALMRKTVNLLQNDPQRCAKLNKISSLCNKRARCIITKNSFSCRCDSGFDGDGFRKCEDGCQSAKCPAGTTCVTMPGAGAMCKCNKRWEKMVNGKCKPVKGHAIKVSKLKLNQVYKKEYKDKNSKAFKAKAAEIEDVLLNSVCKKVGCTAVIVTSIEKGSLVVDFLLVFSSTNVTTKEVQAATNDAIKSEQLDVLGADKTTQAQASQTDVCQSGSADCEENEDCLPTRNGGYTCTCSKGYERKGSECKKTGGLSFVIIIIIIVVAFVVIVTVIACVIWRWKQKRSQDNAKYSMAYNTNENETVQLTGGDYAFSYGGENEQGQIEKHGEPA